MSSSAEAMERLPEVSLGFLFWTFLKVGSTAWGGFMALISVVQNLMVERHRLLRDEEMLDGISLATLLPGPVAVNVVAYVGYRLRGGPGAAVCAFAVVLPSFLLVLGLTVAYFRWGEIPAVSKLFAGFVPAVAAIVLNAAWGMRKKALKGPVEWLLAVSAAALLLVFGGFYLTLGLVLVAGVTGRLVFYRQPDGSNAGHAPIRPPALRDWLPGVLLLSLLALLYLLPIPGLDGYPGVQLFTVFSGMSLMLFGGGFVFIPLIQEVVVDGLQWINAAEFTSAIAMGQVTPGPILISAAFFGYKVWGVTGAAIATAAIFAPPALLMVLASQGLEQIKASAAVQAVLQGVRAAVVGMIGAAAVIIAQTAEWHWASPLIFALALLALLRLKLDVVWVIPAAGLLGLLLY